MGFYIDIFLEAFAETLGSYSAIVSTVLGVTGFCMLASNLLTMNGSRPSLPKNGSMLMEVDDMYDAVDTDNATDDESDDESDIGQEHDVPVDDEGYHTM